MHQPLFTKRILIKHKILHKFDLKKIVLAIEQPCKFCRTGLIDMIFNLPVGI